MGAVILDHRRLAREHIKKLVFLFVPVSVGRTGSWLERLDIGAEMGQSPRFGITKQFEGAVTLCPVLSALIVLRLIFSDDHLFLRWGVPFKLQMMTRFSRPVTPNEPS